MTATRWAVPGAASVHHRAGPRPERHRRAGAAGPVLACERRTAWDRPGGVANRSGAGDLDVIIYSARKRARLALAGNPTVLLVLFVPATRSSTAARRARTPAGPNWSPPTATTPSTPCTRCGSGCREPDCYPPGASRCPSRTAPRIPALHPARRTAPGGSPGRRHRR
ncbi:MAG: DNA polymerase beta superfamily protein [Trebonia sp.]